MDCTGRPAVDRAWRFVNQHGSFRRCCAFRVLAFKDGRCAPKAASSPPVTSASPGGPRARPAPAPAVPLTLEHVNSLQPAALAASLLEHTRRNASRNSSRHGHHSDTSGGGTRGNCTTTDNTSASNASGGDSGGGGDARPVNDARLYDTVARRVVQDVYDFDASSLVDVLEAYSRAGQGVSSKRDALAVCCATLTGKMDELSAPDLTRLAVACAALELHATDLLAALCARAGEPQLLSQFSPSDLTALLEALSRLQHRSPAFFTDAADRLTAELQSQLPHRPAGHVWRGDPPGHLSLETRQTREAAAGTGGGGGGEGRGGDGGLSPEQAVAAVWAMASAGLYRRQLFDGAGALLMDRLGELGGNTLARTAWAYATIRHADEGHRALRDRDLFDGIAGVCLDRGVSTLPPRALVTLLWSFASIPHYDGPLFDAVAAALAPHLLTRGSVDPPDLVVVAWSLQRVGHTHVGLLEALGQAALGAADELDGEDLTAIALAFPATKAYSEGLFKHLVSRAQSQPQLFGQVVLLDLIRLVSRVQHREPEYYGPALQVLLDHVHQAFLETPVDKAGCMNRFRFG